MPVIPAVIEFGEYRLDRTSRAIFRNLEPVKLTAKPFELLEFLIANHMRVVSKEELLQKVWGGLRDPNVIEQTIRQLRLVLEVDPKIPQYIVTVMGAGYKFAAPLSFPDTEPMMTSALEEGEGKNRHAWTRHSIVICLTLLGFGLFLYTIAPGEPAACEVSVNTLIVKDGQGREVWRREFPESLNRDRYAVDTAFCEFADLDGDGTADVLFPLKRQSYLLHGDTLYGFVTRSRMLRRLRPTPARTLTFQPGADSVVDMNSDGTIAKPDKGYLGPYTIAGIFKRNNGDSRARIVVSSVTNYASNQIAVLDSDLKKTSEYWHTGHLKYGQLAKYNGHDRLFLGGVNNGYHSATLVAFDPSNIHGTTDLSIELPDRRPDFAVYAAWSGGHLTPFGAGTETCRVLFERTCVAKATPHREPYNRVIGLTVGEDRISVTVAQGEREDTPERITYEMDRHLNLVVAFPNAKFQQKHLELERAGLLDHSFSAQELTPLIHVLPGCEFVEKGK